MRAVISYNHDEYVEMTIIWNELKDKIGRNKENYNREDLIDVDETPSYGRYRFSGEYKDKLVELLERVPTEDEIIMIVDDGFYHFGAKCTIEGKSFKGFVDTD